MNYYKNNIFPLFYTIPSIPYFLLLLIFIIIVLVIFILKIELYDSNYFYAIKYKEEDYLSLVVPLETSEEILKYEYLEYDKKQLKINDISILTPKTEQLYKNEYNVVSIKLDDYDDIPNDVITKIKLLKNKQSIFKKLFDLK